jgi:site-specific DNA recombinase
MIRAATTKRAPATTAAVAYVRMSTDKQEDSPEQQRDEIRALAAREGFNVVREYYDGGISGTESDKRHDFKRLIKDAQERRDFEVILCRDQDRFSRFDPLEANHYWFLLRQVGVRIVTARQGELNFDELAGWLTASITQHGKAQYIRDISANVLGARLRSAQQGKWTHNRAPYGYERTKDGELVLADKDCVKTVRWIFETYVDRDVSLADMAAELNRRGVPAPTERGWRITTIQHILHREAYLGSVSQFKSRKGKFFTVSGGRVVPVRADDPKKKPESEWMTVKCPPLIDKTLWDRAQDKLVKRRRATCPHPSVRRPLLAGLLFCGHCGERMYAAHVPRKNGKSPVIDRVYACSSYNANGKHKCFRNVIHEKPLLDYLVGQIRDRLLAPENFGRLRAEMRRQLVCRSTTGGAEDAKRLRARLTALDSEIKSAVKELRRTPDDLYALAVDELRELRNTREKLAADLAALEGRQKGDLRDIDSDVAKALKSVETLKERLVDADPAVAREALGRACERIDLWWEHRHFQKQTRSYFKKGLIRFHDVSDSLRLTNRPN